jgi:type II secretory pathway pseudopilin PulG
MMGIKEKIKQNAGDTLIEVLLSIAIAGAVIVVAYSLASHSLEEGVSAAERSTALKLAEGQVESLIAHARSPEFKTPNSNFCFDTSILDDSNPQWGPQYNKDKPDQLTLIKNSGNYNSKCVEPDDITPKYFVNVQNNCLEGQPCTRPTYLVIVRWDTIGGDVQSRTQLYYRF